MDLIELEISKTQSIRIYLPCKKEELESFDYVTIKYLKEQSEYILYDDDFIIAAIRPFKNLLEKALNLELQIKSEYINKGIGYYYNIYSNELSTTYDLSLVDPGENFIVWGTPSHIGIETFIYNVQDQIYIEISPHYKWLDGYPEDEDEAKEYVTFENFINNYQPIDIVAIDKSVAEKWLKFCCEMIEMLKENDKKYSEGD